MNGDAQLQRAADLIQAGNLGDGAAVCRQLLASQPGHPDALHLLAMATRSSDPQGAERLFRESLARAPRQPSVLVNLANFLRASSRSAEAEPLLRAATEIAPDFVPGWYNLGILLRQAGRLERSGRLREQDQRTFARVRSRLGARRRNRTAARRPRRRDRRVPDWAASCAGRGAPALLARATVA